MGAISPRASSMAWKAGSWRGRDGLEGHDTCCLGCAEDFQRLCFGGAEGFLDDDVLATGDAGKGLLVVKCVRAADIDGVDVGGYRKLIE